MRRREREEEDRKERKGREIKREGRPIVSTEILAFIPGARVNDVTTARERVRYPRAWRIDFLRGIGHGVTGILMTESRQRDSERGKKSRSMYGRSDVARELE